MTTLPNQPRASGDERARQQLFGADLPGQASPDLLKAGLVELAQVAKQTLARAADDIASLIGAPELGAVNVRDSILGRFSEATERISEACQDLQGRDVGRPFRVVLMGRTMAGKSTLFEFLTGGDGASVGQGGQRTTRESHSGTIVGRDIEIVDTPGVGAMDGDEDYAEAFGQVADADLILWVATNEATQEQTGRALQQLADYGKPILVALNCLKDVTDELRLLDLLEDPEVVFGGDTLGNLKPIQRHLARAGGRYISAVLIHAQAALLSLSDGLGPDGSGHLRQASRIELLLAEVAAQKDRTADLRRAASIGDSVRDALLDAASTTAEATAHARYMLAASRGSRDDFKKRADRRVADAHAELISAFAVALSRRERWIERVDVGLSDKGINAEWANEIEALKQEIRTHADETGQRLERDLKQIALDVADDWARIDVGGFEALGGRGAIWGNRLVKVGGRFTATIGATILGAKVGAVVGTALGPGWGNAIGLGLGAIIGLLTGLLGLNRGIDWVGDRIFRNAVQIRERRREKVRDQLSPLLVQVGNQLADAGDSVRVAWQRSVDQETERHARTVEALESVERTLDVTLSVELERVLTQVDTEIAREFLQIMGRGRAAAALIRATRWRGAGMAVELPEPEFSELVLFPLAEDVERVLPTAASATPSASAVQLIRNMTDRTVTVRQWNDQAVRVELRHPLALGAREAWQSLALTHTGVRVNISEHIEGDAS